jgi:hypothetical protein
MLRFVAVAAERLVGWASSAAGPEKIFRTENQKNLSSRNEIIYGTACILNFVIAQM